MNYKELNAKYGFKNISECLISNDNRAVYERFGDKGTFDIFVTFRKMSAEEQNSYLDGEELE